MLHQAIEVPTLNHHLLCPMQCQVIGVVINECPKFLCPSPTQRDHALIVTDPDDIESELIIPLQIKGVTPFLSVLKPTKDQ